MKYKYFSILFLAVLVSLGGITFSMDESESSEESATWWSQNISEIALVTDLEDIEGELKDLRTAEKRLALMENILQSSNDELQTSYEEKKGYIEKLRTLQKDIQRSIRDTESEITQLEKDVLLTRAEIKRLQGRIDESARFLRISLGENYRHQEQTKTETLYTLILGQSLGDTFTQSDISNYVQSNTENLLQRQKDLKTNQDLLEKSLARKILIREQRSINLTREYEHLKESQSLEKTLLADMETNQFQLQKKSSDVTQRKMNIQAKILQKKNENVAQFEVKFGEYEKILRERFEAYNCSQNASPACIWMEKYLALEKEMMTKNITTSDFVWPMNPANGFGPHFRDQKYYNQNNTHHEGLDILTPLGMPIVAIADGYILIKQNPSATSPGVVIVKHANGYMSVYSGINPNRKSMFTKISAGDSLGTSRVFMEHAGENHIHVELYRGSKPVDILEKLDISVLVSNKIPARYGWKYIDDLKKNKKTFDVPDLQQTIGFFYVEGDTERERQKNFLLRYASEAFQNRDTWIAESLPESVDPTFVMCVGFAESTLGKNLTTNGNVGNVGNTDSGDRRDYTSPESGIRAIAAVVNNNWLGGYTTIDELSGWGNPRGPIYASSRTNWHENIVKCMSAIKGKFVGNSSTFRLNQASLLLYEQEGFTAKKDV